MFFVSGYTFFVPTDKAFKEVGLGGKPEFYLSRGEGLKLLLNHFVPTRLYNRDLINGQQFKTLGGKTIHVKREGENVTIGNANIIESEVFVYNLGTMYYIDRVLFTTSDDILVTTEAAVPESSTTWTSELPHDVEALPSELTEESGTLPDLLFEPDNDSPTEDLDTVLNTTADRAEVSTEENTDGTFSSLGVTTGYEEHVLREDTTTEIPENQNSSTGILNSSVSLK
jgi:hypothetical protein